MWEHSVGLMPRTCTVCTHARRGEIDRGLVAGRPIRETSALFRVSEDAVGRHKAEHIPPTVAKAQQAADVAQADDLLVQVRALRSKAMSILLAADRSG